MEGLFYLQTRSLRTNGYVLWVDKFAEYIPANDGYDLRSANRTRMAEGLHGQYSPGKQRRPTRNDPTTFDRSTNSKRQRSLRQTGKVHLFHRKSRVSQIYHRRWKNQDGSHEALWPIGMASSNDLETGQKFYRVLQLLSSFYRQILRQMRPAQSTSTKNSTLEMGTGTTGRFRNAQSSLR